MAYIQKIYPAKTTDTPYIHVLWKAFEKLGYHIVNRCYNSPFDSVKLSIGQDN